MASNGRQRVLLVEDEVLLRETIAANLEDEGFDVFQAGDGEEALHLIREHADGIDWLMTDIRLPGALDGWHVAFEFRFLHPLRPVIYVTGHAPPLPPMVAGSLFLRKPYTMAQVTSALRQLSTS
ncbi:response regulator [uncultured Alsobacter sp.]|uniref:response regulator n=1 Tax=uncultured Alsobacter sp. TaxID=1748258 RepID=UPI0025D66EE6|nr:response regulator [uncultured Alsobacter sp.]